MMNHICRLLKQTNPYHSFQSEFHSNLTWQVTIVSKTKSNAFQQKSFVNTSHSHFFMKKCVSLKVPKVLRNGLTYSKLRHHAIS